MAAGFAKLQLATATEDGCMWSSRSGSRGMASEPWLQESGPNSYRDALMSASALLGLVGVDVGSEATALAHLKTQVDTESVGSRLQEGREVDTRG